MTYASTRFVCGFALAAATMLAQNGLPSSKATAQINTLVKCTTATAQVGDDLTPLKTCVDLFSGATLETTGDWVTIMEKPMKLSNSQSIFVSPSLVTGLYTQTRTKTTTGSTSTAQAMGGVYMRAVLIPANGGAPIVGAPINQCGLLNPAPLGCVQVGGNWGVELDTRIQTLSQSLSECTVIVGDLTGTCSFTSIIDFVLHTTSAHTFNFIFPNVGQGTYTIRIQAAVASSANILAGSGTAIGAAAFGLGSMVAESVRLVNDFSF
jgi:hypothetical protein